VIFTAGIQAWFNIQKKNCYTNGIKVKPCDLKRCSNDFWKKFLEKTQQSFRMKKKNSEQTVNIRTSS
jgi:hypothetical protein